LLRLEPPGSADALRLLETTLLEAIHRLRREPAARQTYEVMLWKCEYVDELAPVRTELMKAGEAFAAELHELYAQAAAEGLTERGLDPRLAALETLCLYAGMVKLLAGRHGRRAAAVPGGGHDPATRGVASPARTRIDPAAGKP